MMIVNKNKYYNDMQIFLKIQDAKHKARKLGRKIDHMDTEIALLILRYRVSRSTQDLETLSTECAKYLNLKLKCIYDGVPIYFMYKINRKFYDSEEYQEFIKTLSI